MISAFGRRGHGVHSPFVFDFITRVLKDPSASRPLFHPIELLRKKWMRSPEMLPVVDLGAGSSHDSGSQRKVGDIVRYAVKPSKFGRLFYRMIRHYNIESVLELGTSLGVTTRYFAAASPANGVVSIEGAPAIAAFAARSLELDHIHNVRIETGDFMVHLERELAAMKGPRLLYVDGNHRYGPTMEYLNTALRHVGNDDIFIFDDIHWSSEMERAWDEIRNCKEVTCTIDLFFIGIVFFRKEFKEKLDFSICF